MTKDDVVAYQKRIRAETDNKILEHVFNLIKKVCLYTNKIGLTKHGTTYDIFDFANYRLLGLPILERDLDHLKNKGFTVVYPSEKYTHTRSFLGKKIAKVERIDGYISWE